MSDHLDAYLDSVLIGGREPANVIIADYDPLWAHRFEAERRRISTALGAVAKSIEHIGSTSVPGLAAKPIVDILVTLADVDDEPAYRRRLESAGYALRVREPGHRMFRTTAGDVHLHACQERSNAALQYRHFRDRLRANDKDRNLYEQKKRELAKQQWSDVNYYADAKSAVIASILEGAT